MVPGGFAIGVDVSPHFALSESGHERVENRALRGFPTDGMEMDFPFARSVVVVRSERTIRKTGVTPQETWCYVSSLEAEELALQSGGCGRGAKEERCVLMNGIGATTLLHALEWRYATKKFDSERRIAPETWSALERSLVLTPSSYGLQPWRFVVVTDPEIRGRLVKHSWGQAQPADCSHFVVFAGKTSLDAEYVDRFLALTCEVRGIPPAALAGYRNMMLGDVVNGPRSASVGEWAARQAYIALGQFMASCALLEIDTCPMEGIVPAQFDSVLGLEGSGYTTVVACAAGYRSLQDKYGGAAKVRFSIGEMVQTV